MAKAKFKLPKKRLRVTLDDAIFISDDRVYVDLITEHGDLLLAIDTQSLASLIGEVTSSVRVNPMQRPPRPKIAFGAKPKLEVHK